MSPTCRVVVYGINRAISGLHFVIVAAAKAEIIHFINCSIKMSQKLTILSA